MNDFDVDPDEMADQVDFESFTERVLGDLRMEFSSGPDPTPPPALAAVLTGGLLSADLVSEEPAPQANRRIRVKRKAAAFAGKVAGMTAAAKVALAATAVGALAGGSTLATSMISADHSAPVVTVETSTTAATPNTPVAGVSPIAAVGENEQGDDNSQIDEPGTTATTTEVETDDPGEATDHDTEAPDSETDATDDADDDDTTTVAPTNSSSPSTLANSDGEHESDDSDDTSSSTSEDGSDD